LEHNPWREKKRK